MNLFERAQKYTGGLTRLSGGKGGEMQSLKLQAIAALEKWNREESPEATKPETRKGLEMEKTVYKYGVEVKDEFTVHLPQG